MLNFEAFTGRDLQNTITLLTVCEKQGVTEISVLKKEIENYFQIQITKGYKSHKKEIIKIHKERQGQQCPSCKEGILLPVLNTEKLLIVGCKKCRYSEVMK